MGVSTYHPQRLQSPGSTFLLSPPFSIPCYLAVLAWGGTGSIQREKCTLLSLKGIHSEAAMEDVCPFLSTDFPQVFRSLGVSLYTSPFLFWRNACRTTCKSEKTGRLVVGQTVKLLWLFKKKNFLNSAKGGVEYENGHHVPFIRVLVLIVSCLCVLSVPSASLVFFHWNLKTLMGYCPIYRWELWDPVSLCNLPTEA
jgi:hypothetical protein